MKNALSLFVLAAVLLFCMSAAAQNKVVVVPLGGAVGDATATDIMQGKTFSSKAGKGLAGTLELKAGAIYTNSLGMEFRLIPAGSFVMGSPDGTSTLPAWPAEFGRDSDELQHVVTLTKSFYMQTTEVTQGQWQQVMGSNPSHFNSCGSDCPVEQVSWNDAQNFIAALNANEGRTNCNATPDTCYTLPTESQWEYAARGGTVTAFYIGTSDYTADCTYNRYIDYFLWYCSNSSKTTHPVAMKRSNTWGLYDMSGNVWEWCADWYGAYPGGPVTDPAGPASGSDRVIRGGSWYDDARWLRSANRLNFLPGNVNTNLGFRLVLPSGQ